MQCVPKQPLASFESWLVRNMAKVTFLSVYELNINIEKTYLYFSHKLGYFLSLLGGLYPQNRKIKSCLCSYLLRRSDFTPGSLKESVAHHASNMHGSPLFLVVVVAVVVALLLFYISLQTFKFGGYYLK